jgi:hypothetical protein
MCLDSLVFLGPAQRKNLSYATLGRAPFTGLSGDEGERSLDIASGGTETELAESATAADQQGAVIHPGILK